MVIYTQAELVEPDLAASSSSHETIEKIKDSVVRGSEIVRQLMIYAERISPITLKRFHVSGCVEEMLEPLKISISKHAVLKTALANDVPLAWGNTSQIRQVVMTS